MDLALDVGVSPRHLSFVETGRSRPSPELLLTLAEHLEVPLRERNIFLLAAGYAPPYPQTPLEDGAMASVRAAIQQLLDGHDPYPGVAIDRSWNVVQANQAATQMVATLPTELTTPTMNVFRACLHPDGLARSTLNFTEWAGYLLGQLRRLTLLTNDPDVSKLLNEVSDYRTVRALATAAGTTRPVDPALLVPWIVRRDDSQLSFFTTLTTFGTPRDVTLDELAIELFYPADPATAQLIGRSRLPEPTG
jgi:transcriptional regulator with XRE-family HTH domain